MNLTHLFTVRVYAEDTDCFDVVYHGQYLGFLSRGREEWLRNLGYPLARRKNLDLMFAVRHVDIRYDRTAHLGDLLVLETHLSELKRVSLKMDQTVWRVKDVEKEIVINQMGLLDTKTGQVNNTKINFGELELVCQARIQLACLDSNLRLRALDPSLMVEMQGGQ